jgi:hypothetical protein
MKTLSLKLPDALFSKLTALAQNRGESRSALVRDAIREMIAGHGIGAAGSSLDLAGDLVGCIEGPVDLSVSEDHLHGYGQ